MDLNLAVRNIGILAHVDAGKTTLTEQLLLATGAIRAAGRVDTGTAHTDTLEIERQRGISVRASATCVIYRNVQIRVIDTPGHVDFSTEVENALLALDGAIVVVSAVEGVQAQTAVILNALQFMKIPLLIFINKIDRAGADVARVINQLRAFVPQMLRVTSDPAEWIDCLTYEDETLLEDALNGEVGDAKLKASLARACMACRIAPVLEGAALKSQGIEEVLNAVVDYLPAPVPVGQLCAVVHHVERVENERRTHVRVFGGELSYGQFYEQGRISRIRLLTPQGFVNAQELTAGDIGVVVGLDGLMVGDWLGEPARIRPKLAEPILRAQVKLKRESDITPVKAALLHMADEWPDLNPRFEPRTRQIWVQVMGEIHRQVVEHTLLANYGIPTELGEPAVLYRETPVKEGRGELEMFISPWYARALFTVRPGERGSGVQFVSRVSIDRLYAKYHRDIESSARRALMEGVSGWPVTDVEVELTDGYCIRVKRPGSHFGPVVPLGLFRALDDAGTCLMEPILNFELQVPSGVSPDVVYDLSQMRAIHEPPAYTNDQCFIEGQIPAETSLHYATRVSALTRGRGLWRTWFRGYELCPPGVGTPIERTEPNPLEVDLYMKYIRGVMQ